MLNRQPGAVELLLFYPHCFEEEIFFILSVDIVVDGNMLKNKAEIAVSACLLGQAVRYDGKEKTHSLLVDCFTNQFSSKIKLIPFCPEVGAGMGVPRPKIQLVRHKQESIRVLGVENHTLDVTEGLQSYARMFIKQYPDIQYIIVKSRSPSCGYQSTPLFTIAESDNNTVLSEKSTQQVCLSYEQIGLTSGMFVQTLLALKPELNLVDELAFSSEQDCVNFCQQVLS